MSAQVAPKVEVAGAGARPAIEALLGAAALPIADVASATNLQFWVVRDGERVVGAVGLERYGPAGLVRSLVVAPERRGDGLGGALVDALEQHARAAGIASLVLLTQTAEEFFARRGYERVERAAAPEPVRASAEFRSLCPASATTMSKALG
jgi:N-acetylglutamate synthase-like GNAT family acetyltransferase